MKPVRALRLIVCLAALAFHAPFVKADSDERTWTDAAGDHFRASLLSYDVGTGMVALRDRGNVPYERALDSLSPMDRAWVKEYTELEEEFGALRESMPGTFEHLQVTGEYVTDFYVYYPSIHRTTPDLPLLILFHPNGKGARFINRFVTAAEEAGLILIAPDAFRNTFKEEEEEEFDVRFAELRQAIEKQIRHDPKRVFMGGISGGAARAFSNAVNFPGPWAGIWSNGGWLGSADTYEREYPAGMRVAIVNGHLDKSANHYVERDRKMLEARGSTVKSFSFEGGHQVPPDFHQVESFKWLLGIEKEAATSGE